jgi:ubiquinone/menaquinone biosynthesis C-methylase UbiE
MGKAASARRYGTVFDEVAVEYDRRRPTYPDGLIAQACQLAGIGSGDQVLEVGCGTGQLTSSLLARGLQVAAIEPGRHLISLAEEKLRSPGQVEFVNARFEDAPVPHRRFPAVFSASAFHWIDPDVSWKKAACLLDPGGTLALIQYCGLEEPESSRDQRALLAVLTRIAPEITAEWPPTRDLATIAAGAEQRRKNVSEVWAWIGDHDVARGYARRLFCDVRIASVTKRLEHTADELNGLLRTLSFHHRLSSDQRQALEREHAEMYERLGRPIRSGTVAVLVTARRTGDV